MNGSKERCSGKRLEELHVGERKNSIVKWFQVEGVYEYDESS